jgi:hypothetical protein
MTTIVGIDPGLDGAIAFIRDEHLLTIEDMPTRELPVGEFISRRVDGGGLFDLLTRHCGDDDVRVFVELVRVLPHGGAKNNSAQIQGSLVRTLGAIEAVCDVFGAPATLVTPQQWQAHFGLVSKDREFRTKGALPEAVQTARRLYPRAAPLLARVKDHNRGESLLIAHFGLTRGA